MTQRKLKRAGVVTEHVYGVPVPEALHVAIENERDNLSKAESVLGCLAIAMENEGDSASGPYYPDVAVLARDMIRRSINGLDSLTLQQLLLRDKVEEEFGLLCTRLITAATGTIHTDMSGRSIDAS